MKIVSYLELINITEYIENNANDESNLLLDESICKEYDILSHKRKLLKLFATFKSAQYLYDFPEEDIKITSKLEESGIKGNFQSESKVSQMVERNVDKQILTTQIYNSILHLSKKLTKKEARYLKNTFLNHLSEEDIAALLGISKTYLQKIKKSCIVKTWIELKKYLKEND